MKSIKKISFILLCIVGYQHNNICAQEKTKPITTAQNQANINNDAQILKKLALIDKQDINDNKAIQERSYNSLFNNIINFKKFIVDTFTKKQLQDFFNQIANQIYPEESSNIIDFGKPIVIVKKPEPVKIESAAPTPATAAAPADATAAAPADATAAAPADATAAAPADATAAAPADATAAAPADATAAAPADATAAAPAAAS